MIQQEENILIQEGNILIAKFMGAVVLKEPIGHTKRSISFNEVTNGLYVHTVNGLKYHSSWDWLMPVIEKMSKLTIKNETVISNGEDTFFDSYYPRTFGMIDRETGGFMVRINRFPLYCSKSFIEAAWMAVVNFIKNIKL